MFVLIDGKIFAKASITFVEKDVVSELSQITLKNGNSFFVRMDVNEIFRVLNESST